MRPVGLLFDEHVTSDFDEALRRKTSGARQFRVGHDPAPPTGTPDPELLVWAEQDHGILVTQDHATMPTHFADRLVAGRPCWGVVILDPDSPFAQALSDLLTIAGASDAED